MPVSGRYAAEFVSTRVTTNLALTAAATTSVNGGRQPLKSLSAAGATTTIARNLVGKPLAAAASTSPRIARGVARTVTATATIAPGVLKAVPRAFATSTPGSALLSRQTGLRRALTLNATVTTRRAVGWSQSVGLFGSPLLQHATDLGATVIALTLSTSGSATVTLPRAVRTGLRYVATVTPVGAKTLPKALATSATTTAARTLLPHVNRSLVLTSTTSTQRGLSVVRTVNATIAPSASRVIRTTRSVAASPSAAVSRTIQVLQSVTATAAPANAMQEKPAFVQSALLGAVATITTTLESVATKLHVRQRPRKRFRPRPRRDLRFTITDAPVPAVKPQRADIPYLTVHEAQPIAGARIDRSAVVVFTGRAIVGDPKTSAVKVQEGPTRLLVVTDGDRVRRYADAVSGYAYVDDDLDCLPVTIKVRTATVDTKAVDVIAADRLKAYTR